MVDPIDEWVVHDINNYDGKQLKSVTQGDLDLGELGKEEQDIKKKAESKFKKLSARIKNILSEQVKEVRVTTRLKDSPACLVADDNGMSSQMEKLMKSMGQDVPESKRILEINAQHLILQNLNSRYEKDPKDPELEEWVHLIYEQALIAEGQMVPDPLAYSQRINKILTKVSS
jgi:molecular chaperone HtpG